MRIYYVANGIFRSGGQRVNLEHVLGLRRLGYDARFLIVPPTGEAAAPVFPGGVEAPWTPDAGEPGLDDVVVVGEMFGAGALAVMDSPARKVLHNQGPYFTFKAFVDLGALRRWGCEAIITNSAFAAHMLMRMRWDRAIYVVRPALDPVFAAIDAEGLHRNLSIATMANRRPDELRLIMGIVRSRRPDLASVPWFDIQGLPRDQVARQMASREIFLSLGRMEGLGLPPLEAMAAGALVVGFKAGGGQEYAAPDNGDWFDEDQHFEIASAIIRLLDGLLSGERFEARRAAGRARAGEFSQATFETGLAAAWAEIAGPPQA